MLTKYAARKQIDKLRETIAHHEALYRETLLPVIEDAQFDVLVRQLQELEEAFPEYAQAQTPASDGFAGQTSIPHRVPMLSIHATTKVEEIFKWLGSIWDKKGLAGSSIRTVAIGMPKLDGMALSLFYRNGELVYALTRGRAGKEGQDVTMQAKRLRGVPQRITEKRDVIVRGEVVVSLEAFRRFHLEEANLHYSSPRMAAVGALRSLDGKLSYHMNATFVAYRRMLFLSPDSTVEVETHLGFSAQMFWLANESFIAIPIARFTPEDIVTRTPLEDFLKEYGESRDKYDYATDGAVFAFDDPNAPQIYGQNEHHPHWMIAYKPPAETASSTLRKVTFNVSRTGAIIPVATVDPVEILNKQVTAVSLHSVGFLKSWDLRLDDRVKIGMIHDVVPQFLGALGNDYLPPVAIPSHCPSCQELLVKTPSGLACPNRKRCPAQAVERFVHFTGPKGMCIRGMGPSLVEALIAAGKLTAFSDVYRLTEADLQSVFAGSNRRARAVWTAIQESRVTTLARLLVALGIQGMGHSLAKPLADYYERDLIRLLDITDPQELAASQLVTVGRAKSLITALQSHKDDLRALLDLGVTWPIASHA